jgi:hypothetical protein
MYLNVKSSLELPDYLQGFEKFLRLPIIFTLIYILGGLYAGLNYPYPKKLDEIFQKYAFVRLIGVLFLAFTATGQIEYAIIGTIMFLFIINIIRSPEERKKYPYGI